MMARAEVIRHAAHPEDRTQLCGLCLRELAGDRQWTCRYGWICRCCKDEVIEHELFDKGRERQWRQN